jgi:general stress protein CsbA
MRKKKKTVVGVGGTATMHVTDTRAEKEAEQQEQSAPMSAGDAAPPASNYLSLEERVRRLEDIIASIQAASPEPMGPSHRAAEEPVGSAGIVAAPLTTTAIKEPDPVPPSPLRTLLAARAEPWLLFEIIAEVRAIAGMFFDPRYRMRWLTRMLTIVLIAAIVLCRMWIGSVPLIGWLLDLILFPLLLYVLFKVLSREATRYRSASADLPHRT